jgi:flagellar biosynthesis protein FlhB
MGDGDNRTDKATPRKLEQARKEGNYISTKELVSGAQFIVFAMLLLSGFQEFLFDAVGYTKSFVKLAFSGTELQREGLIYLFRNRLAPAMGGLLVSGLMLSATALVAQLSPHGWFGAMPSSFSTCLSCRGPRASPSLGSRCVFSLSGLSTCSCSWVCSTGCARTRST